MKLNTEKEFRRIMKKAKKKKPKYIFAKRNIFVWLFLIVKGWFTRPGVLHALGSHIITGYPGSGKTLIMNKIKNEVDPKKYFFLSNIPEFNDCKSFDIGEIFENNEQVKSFPIRDDKGRYLYGIIFDEINLTFNKRLNRKTAYNNVFIGLIEFLVSHRHQGVPRVYFIGQKLELQDTQLQSLFKYQHDIIKTKRFPKYWYYYENGIISYLPRKLVVMNRIKAEADEFMDLSKKRYKITRENLESYNTKALAEMYIDLPKVEVK